VPGGLLSTAGVVYHWWVADLGPLGLVAGVFVVVFALEVRRHGEADRGARTAAYATVGILVSTVMQVLLTATVLTVFLLAV